MDNARDRPGISVSDESALALELKLHELMYKFENPNTKVRSELFTGANKNAVKIRKSICERNVARYKNQKTNMISSTPMPVARALNFTMENDGSVSPIDSNGSDNSGIKTSEKNTSKKPTPSNLMQAQTACDDFIEISDSTASFVGSWVQNNIKQESSINDKQARLNGILNSLNKSREKSVCASIPELSERPSKDPKLEPVISKPVTNKSSVAVQTSRCGSQGSKPKSTVRKLARNVFSKNLPASDSSRSISEYFSDDGNDSCETISSQGKFKKHQISLPDSDKPWRNPSGLRLFYDSPNRNYTPNISMGAMDSTDPDETFCPQPPKKKRVFQNKKQSKSKVLVSSNILLKEQTKRRSGNRLRSSIIKSVTPEQENREKSPEIMFTETSRKQEETSKSKSNKQILLVSLEQLPLQETNTSGNSSRKPKTKSPVHNEKKAKFDEEPIPSRRVSRSSKSLQNDISNQPLAISFRSEEQVENNINTPGSGKPTSKSLKRMSAKKTREKTPQNIVMSENPALKTPESVSVKTKRNVPNTDDNTISGMTVFEKEANSKRSKISTRSSHKSALEAKPEPKPKRKNEKETKPLSSNSKTKASKGRETQRSLRSNASVSESVRRSTRNRRQAVPKFFGYNGFVVCHTQAAVRSIMGSNHMVEYKVKNSNNTTIELSKVLKGPAVFTPVIEERKSDAASIDNTHAKSKTANKNRKESKKRKVSKKSSVRKEATKLQSTVSNALNKTLISLSPPPPAPCETGYTSMSPPESCTNNFEQEDDREGSIFGDSIEVLKGGDCHKIRRANDGPVFRPFYGKDDIDFGLMLNNPVEGFSTGYLRLKPGAHKESQKVLHHPMVFSVYEGTVSVDLNGSKRTFSVGSQFSVRTGDKYGLTNLSNKCNLVIQFVRLPMN